MRPWFLPLVVVLAAAFAAAAVPPRVAHAQSDRDAARAAEHFSLAEAAERRGDWQTAILEYKRAHALKPHPSVLFNIAGNYEKLGDLGNAADYYQRYLDDAGAAPDRALVEAKIAELRRQAADRGQRRPGAGSGRLIVRANVDGAAVQVDDILVGKTPLTVQVTAGVHRVTIEAEGHEPAHREVDVPSGGTEEIREFLAPTTGTGGGDGDAPAARVRLGFGFGFGFGLTEAETGRYSLGLNLRLPSDRLELGGYFGRLAKNDTGLGVDARVLFSKHAVKPYARAAFTLGTASFGSDSYRTYGVEGGAGVLYSMAYARNPQTQRAVLTIEYYVEVNARYTGGGVGEDLTVDADFLTTPFLVALDLGLWYRF